jgi:DNA mismatch endonuclease (patch repair protein)
MRLRRLLHAAGFRYRLHTAVPEHPRRTIDIAFPKQRVAVFVDGCYWHACPEHGKVPTTNAGWWAEKLRRNVERDIETNEALQRNGWAIIRAWEHQPPSEVAELVGRVVRARRSGENEK